MLREIEVEQLRTMRESAQPHVLLDVREHTELATAALGGAVHIPIGEIGERFHELPRDVDIVVLCHHGSRSAHVTAFLHERGFTNAFNLSGGIHAWSTRIDPEVPVYH